MELRDALIPMVDEGPGCRAYLPDLGGGAGDRAPASGDILERGA
jgi:hypothetical protein